ncbi:Peptidase S59 domain-containing protein [Meloidogyne graminicola]|uniref:Nuclear pore complex protein Nup98-Nup96 n=1 Tax=Meloidogyne graminicola TaxID=189291 RepID=A0A8S9ZM87_9BILA|nr:Peptidase S59 domain-containing protein [Meloidogyne graminicola]
MINPFPSSTTTASSLFGSQQQTASTSLFGAKPAGSLFGTNISQPSGGIFGQPQPGSSGFGGILGGNKSTSAFTTQPSFFFGQQQPGGLFGTTTTSAPAFGATTTSTSIFGNTVSSFTGFGQSPQQGVGLFGAKPAPPFGSFGVNQPTQQFGTASTGTSLFGQQPQTSIGGGLFGSTSTANKPSLFGSTIGTQQPSGLFNTVKFTPPTGTDTMQLKGQQTQVSTKQMCISAMKEFDSKSLEEIRCADYISGKKVSSSAPASTGALFGTTVSTSGGFFSVPSSTTTASSLFGSQQQTASTSLFGAKPAGSLFVGGIFGQHQPVSSGFASTGGGILGGNKPTSAFSQVSQPTFFLVNNNLGGFLEQQLLLLRLLVQQLHLLLCLAILFLLLPVLVNHHNNKEGGLFGAKPAPPFGSFGVNQPTQQFGTASTGTSLFGQQPQTSIGGGLFGSTNTANKPSLFGSTLGTQQPSGLFNTDKFSIEANVQQPFVSNLTLSSTMNIGNLQKSIIDAQLSTLPYGDSPLLKVSTSPRKSAQDISSLQRQLTFDTKDGQKSPQQNSFLADLSVGTQDLSTKDTSLAESAIFDTNLSYKPIIILPSVGFGAALGLRHSPKLTKSFASEKSFLSGKSSLHSFIEEDKKIKSLDMSVVFEPSHTENVIYVEKPQVNSVVVPLQLSPSEDSERPTIEEIPSPTTTPPPSKEIVQQKTTKIPSSVQQPPKKYRIKLTRPEYYSEPKIEDLECLFNQNGVCIIEGGLTIGRLGYGSVFWKGPLELTEPLDLDEIVHFRNKEVIVYPDESKKPEIGFGLNKPAEVSLDNVWPIDSKTKMPIKDADELRKMNFRGKLERLCLRMDANFCDYLPATGTWQFQVQHFSKYGFQEEEDEDIEVDNNIIQQQNIDINNLNQLEVKRKAVQLQTLVQKAKVPLREIQKFSGEKQQNKREYVQQQQQNNQLIDYINVDDEFNEGINEQFFDDSKLFQEEIIRKKIRFDDTLFDSSKLLTHVTNKEQQQIDYQKPKLVERTPKYIYEGLTRENLKNSILSKSGISIQFPSCRIGFTQDLIFASVPPSTHLNVVNIYQTRVIIPTVKNFFLQYIRSNGLNQQQSLLNLEISSLVKFDPPSPILSFLDEFLTESFEAGKKDLNQSFFEICKILLMETKNIEDKISQRTLMGNWLFNQLENNLTTTKPLNQTKPFLTIFNFLINGNVKKASEYARDMNLFNLALLICCYQTTSVGIVRNLVAKQFSIAQKHKNSDINYLKILQLLSGEFVKESSGGCLQGLNWLQVLGILIWYHSSPTTTLIECLDILQELMN